MPNVDIPQGMDTGGSPRRQETMGGTFAQTMFERVLEQPNEPPLTEGHTSGSGEGRMEHTIELTDTVPPTPHDSPLTGGYTPGSGEGRLKLEELMDLCTILSNRRHSSSKREVEQLFTPQMKKNQVWILRILLKQGRMIKELDKDEDVKLVSKQGEVHETVEVSKYDDDATLAKTLLNIKRSTTKDKGKGIMQETELPKKIKKREMIQLSLDEELAQKLYARELAKETARQEHEKYNLEKALELQRKLDKRKEDIDKGDQTKEIDWNDPTSYFKGMKYEDIRPIFERVRDQVHTFVPKDSEIEKEVMRRYGFHLQHESLKKQKLDQQIKDEEEEVEAQVDSDQKVEEM
nr:hypothetical protein [Tanacetum cinerariifolium]